MKIKGTNKVNVGHERVDKEEVRPSSQRQRIMKALMTDDLARNTEGTDPSSPPTAPASSSSSYSPSRPPFKYGDDVSKSQEISLGSNIHTEELAMRFSENCLEPKDENRENAASIQEMENAIRSLRSWQQNREELIADHSNSSLNFQGSVGDNFAENESTYSWKGEEEYKIQQYGETESSVQFSPRLADDNKIASIKHLMVGPKQPNETSANILKNLRVQEQRVHEVEANLMNGDIDVEDMKTRNMIRMKALELEQRWNTDGLDVMETNAEDLEASLRNYNAELEKYLLF